MVFNYYNQIILIIISIKQVFDNSIVSPCISANYPSSHYYFSMVSHKKRVSKYKIVNTALYAVNNCNFTDLLRSIIFINNFCS